MTTPDVRLAAADLLDKARDLIVKRGKFDPHTTEEVEAGVGGDGSLCALRALATADGCEGVYYRPSEAKTAATIAFHDEALRGNELAGVAAWSDASSYEDVVLTLKRAAHALREAAL